MALDRYIALDMADLIFREGFEPADFLALAQRVWPREYSLNDTAGALAKTVNIGAWDGRRLVGSVRVLTDGYYCAPVQEMRVDPAYRGRGMGRHLMALALDRVPRGKVAFGAQAQSVAFFDRIGWRRRFNSVRPETPLRL